jgi:integrase
MFYEPVWAYGDHQLVRRPDTTNLYIVWYDTTQSRYRRQSTGTADLDEAKQQLIELAKRREKPKTAMAHEASALELLVDYVERTNRDKWRWTAERSALKHFAAFFEHESLTLVSELTIDVQERYVEWRRKTLRQAGFEGSNGSIARELTVLRAALRDAWKRGRLESAPYIMSLPKPPPRQRFLTQEEFRRLIDACTQEHLYRFVMLAVHTLQRPIALFDLRIEQVDLDRGRIDFLPPGELQSNKRRPVVPVTRTLRPILAECIEESVSGYVLEYLGGPLQCVRRSFGTACRQADLVGVTPYTLRHTGATLLAASGVPMRQIAGMLGHTVQKTTEIYAKHHPDFMGEASSALDRLFTA